MKNLTVKEFTKVLAYQQAQPELKSDKEIRYLQYIAELAQPKEPDLFEIMGDLFKPDPASLLKFNPDYSDMIYKVNRKNNKNGK